MSDLLISGLLIILVLGGFLFTIRSDWDGPEDDSQWWYGEEP